MTLDVSRWLRKALLSVTFLSGLGFCEGGALSETSFLKKVIQNKSPVSSFQSGSPVLRDLTFWLNAQKESTPPVSPQEFLRFVKRHPNWSNLGRMQTKIEATFPKFPPEADALMALYSLRAPSSLTGKTFYLKALKARGGRAKACEVARGYWVNPSLVGREADRFLSVAQEFLSAVDHEARFQKLLMAQDTIEAARMVPLLPEGLPFQAREALRLLAMNGKPSASFKKQPHAWIVFATLAALKRAKDYEAYARVCLQLPKLVKHPEDFVKMRVLGAREFLERGNVADAYRVASAHQLSSGNGYAELEWLSGWIALSFQKKPQKALAHFQRFQKAVKSPISVARGFYWLGRSYAALGRKAEAQREYKKGAALSLTYYGHMACHELGLSPFSLLRETPRVTEKERAAFEALDTVKAIRFLAPCGPQAHLFILRLLCSLGSQVQTPSAKQLTIELAAQVHPYVAVDLSRTLLIRSPHLRLLKASFPLKPVPPQCSELEKALVLAVCYRESRFNPTILGAAGELGLMQLMPQTAVVQAEELGIKDHKPEKLLNPLYNMTLGRHFLRTHLTDFGGNLFLVFSAYNGGPGVTSRWLQTFGDPRHPQFGGGGKSALHRHIEWVEMIPYEGVRDYIQRGIEATTIYAGRLGHSSQKARSHLGID